MGTASGRNFRFSTYCVLVGTLALWSSCKKDHPPAPKQEIKASALPKIRVTEKTKALFTYYDRAAKEFKTVSCRDDVPETCRAWVRVVDLDTPPNKRLDHELVYVADLRKCDKNDTFPYVVLSRRAFETRACAPPTASQLAQAAARDPNAAVVLYGTSWCPACKAASRWFTENGVAFVEKDVERDPSAAQELAQKAAAAGISTSGVPVIDVRGTLMQGFDPQRIRHLLAARAAGPGPSNAGKPSASGSQGGNS